MTEIEKVKAQIKVLEKKLEELEKTKSPVEEAYKDWCGQYPETGTWDGYDEKRWQGFQAGYYVAHQEKVSETAQERGERLHKDVERVVKESVKWCEEHPDWDLFDYLKPQTPEQVNTFAPKELEELVEEGVKQKDDYPYKKYTPEETEQSLKEAFREAVKQGVVSSSTKPQTLYDVIAQWSLDSVTDNIDLDVPTCVDNLVDEISLWLPKYQSAAGSQNAYVESAVEGFNDCLDKIRRKLR